MSDIKPIRVLIADDHEIYRDGLRLMFKRQDKVVLVGEAENGRQAIELNAIHQPDVILMDIMMPLMDGVSATKYLGKHFPKTPVIALSMYNDDNLVIDMLEAGAKGYLLKNADKDEIIEAIQAVYMHTPYYCASTTSKLAQMIARSKYNPYGSVAKLAFSDKEIAIMQLICEELTNSQIAEKLFISKRTVEGHRMKIQDKLQVKGSVGVVIYCIKEGLYKPK
ncbi:MAG: response regulator transcription factor [Chitinophagaceae bacterium]